MGKHVQEAVPSFPLTERGDATSSHRAASCGQLKHNKEMPWLRQPVLGNAGWRAADGLVGHGAALAWWLRMSWPQQQQLLHSNHAVTGTPGWGISAARERQGQWEGKQRVPPRSVNYRPLALGHLPCDMESNKALSQQWGKLQAPAFHWGTEGLVVSCEALLGNAQSSRQRLLKLRLGNL